MSPRYIRQIFIDYPDQDLVERFISYHCSNKHIYKAFFEAAKKVIQDPRRKRHGAKAIVEYLRFDTDVRATTGPFKIDNAFTSLYVRMLLAEHKRFRPFFTLRRPKRAA